MKAEVFYLQTQGEQRGPYTVQQIDHLLNSGIIGPDAIFWREGMEEWLPVTDLVALRKPVRRWIKPAIAGAFLLVVLLLGKVLGPTIRIGWKEANQHEFTETAAYWRARDVIRHQAVPPGALVEFAPAAEAHVTLQPPLGAEVQVKGTLTDLQGATREARWSVGLGYDQRLKQWTGLTVKEEN